MRPCTVCGSKDTKKISVSDMHYGIDGEFSYVSCLTCKFIEIENVNKELLSNFYEQAAYYAYHSNVKNQTYGLILQLYKRLKLTLPRRIILFFLKFISSGRFWWIGAMETKNVKFLDVGCGSGRLVWITSEMEYNSCGIDISHEGVNIGKSHNLDILKGDFSSFNFGRRKFDVIHSNHSLEHMEDINSVMRSMKEISLKETIIYLRVPNSNSLTARKPRTWYYFGAPLHLNLLSPTSIKILAKNHNFEVLSIKQKWDTTELLSILTRKLSGRRTLIQSSKFLNNRFLLCLMAPLVLLLNQIVPGSNLEVVLRQKSS